MSVYLYSCDQGQKQFVRVLAERVDLTYEVGELGFLRRTFTAMDLTPFEVKRHSIHDQQVPIVFRLREMYRKLEADIQKIVTHWDWKDIGLGINGFSDFAKRITAVRDNPEYEVVNLSGLGLYYLPFQVGLLVKTKKLDLRNNQLRILPIDLTLMTDLEEIDLRGNPIIKLPSWCETKLAHVKIVSDIFQDNPDDWAQSF